MSDRSLDEFGAGGDDGESDADVESDDGESDADVESDDATDATDDATDAEDEDSLPTDVDSIPDAAHAEATLRFAPNGAPCDACGGTVSRHWRDGDAFVCADCKEW